MKNFWRSRNVTFVEPLNLFEQLEERIVLDAAVDPAPDQQIDQQDASAQEVGGSDATGPENSEQVAGLDGGDNAVAGSLGTDASGPSSPSEHSGSSQTGLDGPNGTLSASEFIGLTVDVQTSNGDVQDLAPYSPLSGLSDNASTEDPAGFTEGASPVVTGLAAEIQSSPVENPSTDDQGCSFQIRRLMRDRSRKHPL